MNLTLIKAGRYLRGSPDSDKDARANEKPQKEIIISEDFSIGTFPVTVSEWRQFAATGYETEAEKLKHGWGYSTALVAFDNEEQDYTWDNVGFTQTDNDPVLNVSWNDAKAYCDWLGAVGDKVYRLPTEAEWEYACRAGTTTRFWCGDDEMSLCGAANIAEIAFKRAFPTQPATDAWDNTYSFTSPMGSFKPNPWGLYDMLGNVWEWCEDWFDENYYATSPSTDPQGPAEGTMRVLRGACYDNIPSACRSAARISSPPTIASCDFGFRVVLASKGRIVAAV